MGKRSAADELFLGNMGSIQRETRPSMQREDQLTMETKLEQIAAKARCEPKLRFTSLAHHITRDRVRKNLLQIPKRTAAGVDGQTVEATKESFESWIEPMLLSIHRQGYRAPNIRRVYIPKPGKTEKRPLGVPTVADRALQRSTAEVLSAIYEQDFLPCSFGGRPKLGAHHECHRRGSSERSTTSRAGRCPLQARRRTVRSREAAAIVSEWTMPPDRAPRLRRSVERRARCAGAGSRQAALRVARSAGSAPAARRGSWMPRVKSCLPRPR